MKNRLINNLQIALAGFLASLIMYFLLYLGINATGIAPFNITPSAAFLYNLGIAGNHYALLLHFSYGILWSYVFVYTFEEDVSVYKAIILAIILWLFMMIVYSPLIGWGIFGLGYAHNLPAAHSLHLDGAIPYMSITLAVHLIYGLTLGYLHNLWLREKTDN